jgi:hemerythrin-like domain-containing protein
MLEEHRLARGFTAEMGDAIEANKCGSPGAPARFAEAADQYIDLLTNHIYKEDNILFAMGDRVMSDEDQSTLREQFCTVGCRRFGGRNREELEQIADALEVKWPSD